GVLSSTPPVSFVRPVRDGLTTCHHIHLDRRQSLMFVLRRENGPQLPDHCQDVPELELGHAWNEGPTRLAPRWPSFTLPGCLQYPLEVSRNAFELHNQLASDCLRALPYRVLIVDYKADHVR
ncbi:MAG: hypothetical protein V3U86_10030, partial [Acidobacteriota bacterium]